MDLKNVIYISIYYLSISIYLSNKFGRLLRAGSRLIFEVFYGAQLDQTEEAQGASFWLKDN